jgi:hypothetical protein
LKSFIPYIVFALVVSAIILLFFTGDNKKNRRFDGRITLRAKDKIPYGSFIAFESLKRFFPKASVEASKQEPGYWDSISNFDPGQAVVIVSPYFNADQQEMKKLLGFIENGNDVFISTMDISYEATQMIKCDANSAEGMMYYFEQTEGEDLLSVSLAKPPFTIKAPYTYPGKRYDFYFYRTDTATATVLGYEKNDHPNFIHLKAGSGNLYLHLAPLTFSNYFLLHGNNIGYYENLLSVIAPNTKRIIWDEYFINKKRRQEKSSGWLSAFLKHKALKWALLTAMLTLMLYVLSEMRRKQRIIPVIAKPRNDSLDFVKTIGRLYHDKGDHRNLGRKMSAYFLEHVRSRYKLATSALNDEFVKNLHGKTGISEEEISEIIQFINNIDTLAEMTDRQLAAFHKKLESFYRNA